MRTELEPVRILAREEARARQAIARSQERLARRVLDVARVPALVQRQPLLALAGAAVAGFFGGPALGPVLRKALRDSRRFAVPATRALGLLGWEALRRALNAISRTS